MSGRSCRTAMASMPPPPLMGFTRLPAKWRARRPVCLAECGGGAAV
jgi:hypothetical protein